MELLVLKLIGGIRMDTVEFIEDNFLGMSYKDQQLVLEYLMLSLKENRMRKLSRDFNDKFICYLEKLQSLFEFRDSYKDFNSDKRRLTRKIVLDELIETIESLRFYYSDDEIKRSFCFSSEYYGEYKKYFEVKPVSSEVVQKFLIDYSNLDMAKKCDFIKDMIFYYDRINHLSLPFPNNMLEDYRPIIQSLIGDELMEYYNLLYKEEQMRLIVRVAKEFLWFKRDNDYYNWKFSTVKEDPKIIRTLKKEAMSWCQHSLSKDSY